MIDWLVEPLQYGFMVRGLVAAALVGVLCGVVGCYVVLRGMAFFGDALAHAILPGVALGYLLGGTSRGTLFGWSLVAGVGTALSIGAVTRHARLREDTAIGIVFAGMFALGIALISSTRGYAVDLTHFLFGNVLGVSAADLIRIAVFGALILLVIVLFYKELLALAFDPILAQVLRLPTGFLHYTLFVLIALAIVVSLQTVGIALMVALLVTPAATAQLLTKRLPPMMVLAAGLGAASGISGLYASYYLNVASGAAIVLVATAAFLLTALLAPRRGGLRRLSRRRSRSGRS